MLKSVGEIITSVSELFVTYEYGNGIWNICAGILQ